MKNMIFTDKQVKRIDYKDFNKLGLDTYTLSKEIVVMSLLSKKSVDILPSNDLKHVNTKDTDKIFDMLANQKGIDFTYNDDNLTKFKSRAQKFILNLKPEDKLLYDGLMLRYVNKAKDNNKSYGIQIHNSFMVMDFDYMLPKELIAKLMEQFGVYSLLLQFSHNKHKGCHIILPINYNKANKCIKNNKHSLKVTANDKVYNLEYDARGAFSKVKGQIPANITIIANYINNKGLLENGEERYSDFILITKDNKLSISEPADSFYKMNTDFYRINKKKDDQIISDLRLQFGESSKVSKETEDFLKEHSVDAEEALANNKSMKEVLASSFNHGKKKVVKKRKKKNNGKKRNVTTKEQAYYVGQFLFEQTKKITAELKSQANNEFTRVNPICEMSEEEARNEIYKICQLFVKYSLKNNPKDFNKKAKAYSRLIKNALTSEAKIARNSREALPIIGWIGNIENDIGKQYMSSIYSRFGNGKDTDKIRIFKGYNQINAYTSLFGVAPIVALSEIRKILDVVEYQYDTSLYGGEVVSNINNYFATCASEKDVDKNYGYAKLYSAFADNNFEYNDELSSSTVLNVSDRTSDEIKNRLIKSRSFNNKECADEPDKIKILLHIWNEVVTNNTISTKENKNSKKILRLMKQRYAELDFDVAEELDNRWKSIARAYNYMLKNSYKAIYVSRVKSNGIDTGIGFEFTFKFTTDFSINTLFNIAEALDNGEVAPTIKYKLCSYKANGESYNNLKLSINGNQQLIKFGSNNLTNKLSNELSKVEFDYDTINDYPAAQMKQKEYFLITEFNYNYLKAALDKIDADNKDLIRDLASMHKDNRINHYLVLAILFATANYTRRDEENASKKISDDELISNNFTKLILNLESNIKANARLNQCELDMLRLVADNFVFINSTNRVPMLDKKLVKRVINLFSNKQISGKSYEIERSEFMKEHGVSDQFVNLSNESIYKDRNYAENKYLQEELDFENIAKYNQAMIEEAEKENNYSNNEEFELATPNSIFSINKFELDANDEENRAAINMLNNYELDDDRKFTDGDLIRAAITLQKFVMSKFTFDVHKLDQKTRNKVIMYYDLQVENLIKDVIKRANKKLADMRKKGITKEELAAMPEKELPDKDDRTKNYNLDGNPYNTIEAILNDMKPINRAHYGHRNNTLYSIFVILERLVGYKCDDARKLSNILIDKIDSIIDNDDQEFTRDKVEGMLNTIIANKYHFSDEDLASFNYVFSTKFTNRSIFSLVNAAKASSKRDERTKIYEDEKLHALLSVLTNKRYATLDKFGNKRRLNTNIALTEERASINIDDVLELANLCDTRIYNKYQTISKRVAKKDIKLVKNFKEQMTPYDMYVICKMQLDKLGSLDGQDTQSTLGFMNYDELSKAINLMKEYVYTYKSTINTLHSHKKRATGGLTNHSQAFIDMAYKTADKKLNHNGKFNVEHSFWGKLSPNDFVLMLLTDLDCKGNTLYASQVSHEDLLNDLLVNLFACVKDDQVVQEVLNSKPKKHSRNNIDLNEENIENLINAFKRYILYQKMIDEEYEQQDIGKELAIVS